MRYFGTATRRSRIGARDVWKSGDVCYVDELTSDLGGLIGSLESSMSAMTDEIGGGIKESGEVVTERYLQPY
jgi:hypothetical protein